MTNNYINERIREPPFAIVVNGKEVKRLPFLKQAQAYKRNHASELWDIHIDIVNLFTAEVVG